LALRHNSASGYAWGVLRNTPWPLPEIPGVTITVGDTQPEPPAPPKEDAWKDWAIAIALGAIPPIIAGVAVHYLTKPKEPEPWP